MTEEVGPKWDGEIVYPYLSCLDIGRLDEVQYMRDGERANEPEPIISINRAYKT